MVDPVVQMTPADYRAFWDGWIWTAMIAGSVLTVAVLAVGYWIVRMAVAAGISD